MRSIDPLLLANTSNNRVHNILSKVQTAADAGGVSCQVVSVVSNEPFEAIIETAENRGCDLILMASHGYRGVKGLLLGSQTQKVLTHSTIPLLVYR